MKLFEHELVSPFHVSYTKEMLNNALMTNKTFNESNIHDSDPIICVVHIIYPTEQSEYINRAAGRYENMVLNIFQKIS